MKTIIWELCKCLILRIVWPWYVRAVCRSQGFIGQQREYDLCVFKPDRVGDFILAISAIRRLIEEKGAERCLLLLNPLVRDLAEAEFPKTAKIYLPMSCGLRHVRTWRYWRRVLSSISCDTLVCLRHQRSFFHVAAMGWIRANRYYGVIKPQGAMEPDADRLTEKLFTDQFIYPAIYDSGGCAELRAHSAVVSAVLRRTVSYDELLPSFHSIQRSIAPLSSYLLVVPFSSAAIKDYPLKQMTQALKQALRIKPIHIILAVSPDQHAQAIYLQEALVRIIDSTVQIKTAPSLSVLLTWIAQSRCLLSVDTGPAHMAVALDVPAVIILGGGHYGLFGPWQRSAKQMWVTHSLECFQCNWKCVHSEPFCVTRIDPHQIASLVVDRL